MSNWDREYIAVEFNKARGGESVQVKVRGEDGESRWVRVPAANLDALIEAAQIGTEG